jgi:hypothetical protein
MRYRKLSRNETQDGGDTDYDYTFGHGKSDFWIDVPDAPAQAVLTRLKMWKGEWFLDVSDGMDWNVGVLGKYTAATRDFLIRARIIQTKGVSLIASYSSSLLRDTREFTVHAELNTVYSTGVIAMLAKLAEEPR